MATMSSVTKIVDALARYMMAKNDHAIPKESAT